MNSRRQRLYRTSGIVLERQDFGEADRILTLFTSEYGKLRVIAKGVRRLTSRKKGHVELFTYSDLLIARGRNLDLVTQADTIRSFREVREDLLRITYAYHMAELVNGFTEEQDENRPLFDLLLGMLGALAEAADLRLVARFFELHLLDCVGYRPQLYRCVACNVEIQPVENFFGFESGGVVCPDCVLELPEVRILRERTTAYGEAPRVVRPLSVNVLKVMRFLQNQSYAVCQALRLQADTHAELERLMHGYLAYLLERELRSIEFLETLRQQTRVLHWQKNGSQLNALATDQEASLD